MFQVGSWHYDKGGTDLFVKTLSHWLARRGHNVVVLAHRFEDEKCDDEDIHFGRGVIKVRYTPSRKRGKRFNPIAYSLRLFVTAKYLYKLAKSEKINALIVGETELASTIFVKFLGTKIICRGGALMYETMSKEVFKERGRNLYSKFFIFLIKIYNNLTLKLPDVMIPVNSSEHEFMNSKKRNGAQIFTIPHGVDTKLFKPLKKSKKKNKISIAYVGRLAPIKHPEIALKIFQKASRGNKNTEFFWVGPLDPSFEKNYFERLKSNLMINNAKYLNRIDNNNLPFFLQKMDIFLQVEQQRNVSRSTTEAAACGIPIVALNEGKEEYGFFTMKKTEAIDELKKLINDKEYRKKRSILARKIIERDFSEDIIYGKYLKLLRRLEKNG